MWLYLVVTTQLLLSGGWVVPVQSQDRGETCMVDIDLHVGLKEKVILF